MKARKICIGIICVIFLAGLTGTLLLWRRRPPGRTVEILQDGAVLYTIDPDTYDGPPQLVIRCPQGQNVIHIEKGSVYVESADCADHTCVEMGPLQSSAFPIVCLPHKLVIRYARQTGMDGVSQ